MNNVVKRSCMIVLVILCLIGVSLLTTKSAFANTGVPYIGPGMANTAQEIQGTRCVQQALHITEDGEFGQQTYDAVKAFQEAHGLSSVDGIVGPQTGDQLLGLTRDPYFCAKWIPTSFMLMDNNGNLAEGGQVIDPAKVLDPGAAVPIGGSPKDCLVKGVILTSLTPGNIVKVLWKHKLDLNPYIAAVDTASCILTGFP